MKHALLIFISVFLITKNVRAKVGVINLDTSINKSYYKLPRKKFLENYGNDDSTKALINFYFNKRGNRLVDAIPPAIGGSLLVFALTRKQSINHTQDDYSNLIIIGPLIIFTTSFVATFIVQEIKRSILTKKKLYIILNNHNHGIRLPERITWKRKFKTELAKLHGKYPQFRLF